MTTLNQEGRTKFALKSVSEVDIIIPLEENEYGYIYVYEGEDGFKAECYQSRFSENMVTDENFYENICAENETNYLYEGRTIEEAVNQGLSFWSDLRELPDDLELEDLSFFDAVKKVRKLHWDYIIFLNANN